MKPQKTQINLWLHKADQCSCLRQNGEGGRVKRERLQRGTRKLLAGDEYVYYLDYGDNFTCAHVSKYINSISTFLKHVQFIICQL